MNKKTRILIVDDDNKLRKTLTDILGVKGFVPMDVADGKTALKRVKESAPAVALIDLKLEDMSGLDLMGEIKALSPSTECIMITGHASQASAIEAVNLGAFSFMLKPYDVEQLLVTIRRAVEKQEALETLRAQYKGIPVPTYTWQWDGEDDLVLVDYNIAAEEITHGKIGGFLGIRAREFYKDTPEILEELFQCFNKKTPIQREMQYQYKSTGESKHLAVKYAFAPPNLVLVHTEDITERKRGQQEVEMLLSLSRFASAETRLDDLLFYIADQIVKVIPPAEAASIFLFDEERKVLQIRAWAGFSENDVKGMEFNVDEGLTDSVIRNNKPTIINDTARDPNFKRIPKKDTDSIKSLIGTPLFFNKRLVGSIFADNLTRTNAFSQKNLDLLESIGNQLAGVIENKRLLENVWQSEEQYRSVVEDSPGVISRFLPDGTITFVNQEYCKYFGKEYDELIGMNIQSVIPEDGRESVMSYIGSITEESPLKTIENKVIRHDGEVRLMRWADRALFDEDGKITSYQSFGEDITERVRAEQLLNALNLASVAMGTALSHDAIFNAVAEELKRLDIICMIFLIDETQKKLFTKHLSFESAILNTAEKLGGVKHEDFSFPIDAVDLHREVVREKKTLFLDNSGPTVNQISPNLDKKLIARIIKILRVKKSITAPLIVEDQVIGVFSIQSDKLTQENVPAATAFADQLSSAWNKIILLQNLRKTVEGTIFTIAATVEARDPYTAGHQTRVADLAVTIATEMHLSDEKVEGIEMAGVIHDLGKVQVPAEILSKPGKISELEYKIIQTHPKVGFDLLKNIEFPWPIAQMVFQHHEMMNGSGYPQGLKGDEILLEARILAVADTVEAMSSHRPYRPAHGIEKALDQIRQDKGNLLDPKVVDACLKIFKGGYKLLED